MLEITLLGSKTLPMITEGIAASVGEDSLKNKLAVENNGKAHGGLLKPNPKGLPADGPVALPVFEEEEYLTDAQVMAWLHVKK